MSLTDKEIALELTKSLIEHYNKQVENKSPHSHLEFKNVEFFYKSFYNAVSSIGKSTNQDE